MDERLTLLFVDLLGTRAQWHAGGRAAAERMFAVLEELVADSVTGKLANTVRAGVVETDSAAIVCASAVDALLIARKMYRTALATSATKTKQRLWLRGAVTRINTSTLVSNEAIRPKLTGRRYTSGLMDAITIEKSGIRGMRLVVTPDAVPENIREQMRMRIGRRGFVPFSHLQSSGYFGPQARELVDFLWMATENTAEFEAMKRFVENRLRWSAPNGEEFTQAAATQLLFHECAAQIGGIQGVKRTGISRALRNRRLRED